MVQAPSPSGITSQLAPRGWRRLNAARLVASNDPETLEQSTEIGNQIDFARPRNDFYRKGGACLGRGKMTGISAYHVNRKSLLYEVVKLSTQQRCNRFRCSHHHQNFRKVHDHSVGCLCTDCCKLSRPTSSWRRQRSKLETCVGSLAASASRNQLLTAP